MRKKGMILLVVLVVCLVGILLAWEYLPALQGGTQTNQTAETLLDSMMDRIGVTQWSEAIEWYEMEEAGLLSPDVMQADTPVWVARTGITHFHSNPLCANVKNPVKTTMGEAEILGFIPCTLCWEIGAS